MQEASTSWLDQNKQVHIRVYAESGGVIKERCWDADGWYTGAFSQPGRECTATSWVDNGGQVHIRVYVASNGSTSEYCWDKDRWYKGAYTNV